MARRCLASLLACLFAGSSLPGASAPLAVVTQSERGHLGTVEASAGATIYDGDKLSTDDGGVLRLRSGTSSLYLPARSGATLHATGSGALAELTFGSILFYSSFASAMEVRVREVRIRPVKDTPTVAQISVMGPKELRVTARRGALVLTYGNDTEPIEEGATYRVLLDPTPADIPYAANGRGPGSWPADPPKPGAKIGKLLCLIIIGGPAWVTGWAIHEAWESPDRP